jgi:hypothetical protein
LAFAGAATGVLRRAPDHWYPASFADRTLSNAASHGRLLHNFLLIIQRRMAPARYIEKRIGVPLTDQSQNAAADCEMREGATSEPAPWGERWLRRSRGKLPAGSSDDRGGDGCDHPPIQSAEMTLGRCARPYTLHLGNVQSVAARARERYIRVLKKVIDFKPMGRVV